MAKGKMSPLNRSKRGLQNKRYRQTEEAIIEVLLKARTMPNTGEIARRARISRSTLYRHHRAIPGIVPDYERGVLREYRRVVRRTLRQKEVNLRKIHLRMLVFVLAYKRVYGILFRYSGDRAVERMVTMVEGKIVTTCRLPKGSQKAVRIYAKEVAGIVEMWGEKGFKEDRMGQALNDIMKLTDGLKGRLGAISRDEL